MELTINEKAYSVEKLLGKGKGGYSYLVSDGAGEYVIKQIHHEPCDYYQFGDKLASERRDYARLKAIGIPMPELLAADVQQERILKEYIAGPTVAELLRTGRMESGWLEQVRAIDKRRLKERMGALDGQDMGKVDHAISVSFGL